MTERDDHPLDYLAELALGVLDEGEAGRLRAHLAGCSSCSAEFGEMTRVARLLPLAAEDMAPAPMLREAVLARIGGEPRGPRPADPRPGAEPIPIRRPRWQWFAAVAASAAVLVVAGGAAGFALRTSGDSTDLERAAARQALVVSSAARGDLRVAHGEKGAVRAAFVRAPGQSEGFVLVEGLPPLPEGKAYQGWYTKDGTTFEPSGVFKGEGGAWLPAGSALDGYTAMALTVEDESGARVPSQDPFVVVDLSKSVRLR